MKKLFTTIAIALLTMAANAQKYVGGDISLFTKYEEKGAQYLDSAGNAIASPLSYFKEQGMNAMRVRLFVDPSKAPANEIKEGVLQDLEYVKTLGKRIKDAGYSFMLDFHYSDTWADPSNQWTPDAWKSLSDNELYAKIYEYTKESLQSLIEAGAQPDMIQIGNEISYGMLWGTYPTATHKFYLTSSTDTSPRFYTLLENASKACREVCPEAKVIVHTERVPEPTYLQNFYEILDKADFDYDVIGLSYYPDYHGDLTNLENALSTLEKVSDKEIMIVETGYGYAWQLGEPKYKPLWGISDDQTKAGEAQAQFTTDLIAKLKEHKSVTGLFWWDMDANEYGNNTGSQVTSYWWNASLFDSRSGKAMKSLYLLKDFLEGSTGISRAIVDAKPTKQSKYVYSLDGRIVSTDGTTDGLSPGLYIHNGKKVVIKH